MFTNNQLKTLSGIAADVSQVLLASTVIPYFTGLDRVGAFAVVSGLVGTVSFWIVSVVLSGRMKDG